MVPEVCMCKQGYSGKTCEVEEDEADEVGVADVGQLRASKHEAICSVYGLHHYTTFDGKKFYFPGECSYSFVIQKGGNLHVMVGCANFIKLE